MEEVDMTKRKKCAYCDKTISFYMSDATPDWAMWRHIDGTPGHEIDASNN